MSWRGPGKDYKILVFMSDLTCPVSEERVDENATRVGAFFVIATTLVALYTNWYALSLLLATDFALRAFTNGTFSPLKHFAKIFAIVLQLPKKPIDAAPKKFAAGVGFVFALSIAIAQVAGFILTSYSIGAVLLVCAALESFVGYCVGCVVYTYLVLPVMNKFQQLPPEL